MIEVSKDVTQAAEAALAEAQSFLTAERLEGASDKQRLIHEAFVSAIEKAIHAERQRDQWQDISTAPIGRQILVWEKMYGWLICCKSAFDQVWRMKTGGNYWMDVPASTEFVMWRPIPEGPSSKKHSEYTRLMGEERKGE